MRRWSVSTECVAVPIRTIANCDTARLVDTVMLSPFVAVAGAAVMTGRDAALPSEFSRFGGVKISPSKWLVAQPVPHRPPPPVNTRPSGISSATLWYVRGTAAGAMVVNCSVAGSHISALRTAVLSENGTGKFWPPNTTTLPSGSTTLLWNARGLAIGATLRVVTVLPLMVRTYAPALALTCSYDVAPPTVRILPASYMTALPFIASVSSPRVPALVTPPVPAVEYQFIARLGPACSTVPLDQANSQAWLSLR